MKLGIWENLNLIREKVKKIIPLTVLERFHYIHLQKKSKHFFFADESRIIFVPDSNF
jgi:hypothetical protein